MTAPLTLPLALDTLLMKVIEVNGVIVPIRRALNFVGTVTFTDNPSNDSSDIQIGGGGGGGATTLEASFTQPIVGGTVNPLVLASGGYQVGEGVEIAGGGFYAVTAIPDGTHLTIQNLGSAVNALPGATVTSGVLIEPSGPPNTLIQVNNVAVTQRGALDFRGLGYTDDAANNRIILDNAVAPPAATVSAAYTPASFERWVVFTGGTYPITMQNAQPGELIRLTHVGPTRLETSAVTVAKGTATFTIENPQDRSLAGASSQSLSTSFVTYNFMLDSTNNVLRCVGIG